MTQAANQFIDWFFTVFDPRWAQFFGFAAFWLLVVSFVIRCLAALIRRLTRKKTKPIIQFRIDDVNHALFKKKGYLTFDLILSNTSSIPFTILQAGVVLADGSEAVIRDEAGNAKTPDNSLVEPGQNALFDNCDFFYTVHRNGLVYKKIDRLFADLRGIGRVYGETNINPLLNDRQIRDILTDIKGLNGF